MEIVCHRRMLLKVLYYSLSINHDFPWKNLWFIDSHVVFIYVILYVFFFVIKLRFLCFATIKLFCFQSQSSRRGVIEMEMLVLLCRDAVLPLRDVGEELLAKSTSASALLNSDLETQIHSGISTPISYLITDQVQLRHVNASKDCN